MKSVVIITRYFQVQGKASKLYYCIYLAKSFAEERTFKTYLYLPHDNHLAQQRD